ncbi:MAG: glycosyltransferase family 1 protein, partial [Thalassolituus sp.]
MISRPLCSRHLCIVTETYLPEVNGVANSLRHLISHLNPNLYRVSIVRTSPRTEFAQPANEVWVKGVTIPQYPDLQLGLPARQRMKKLWRKDPPDAVYVATEGLLGASAVSLARELGIPVISAFHTNFHRYSGYYGLGWIRSAVMAWMRRFHNRTGATLVPSRAMVEELTSAGIERVEWLPHGVDCERFNPQHRSASLRVEWGVKAGERVLLYVGRLAAEKNIRTALIAAEQAQAAGAAVRVVVVGDGPLAASLKERFPEVVFTGVKTGLELSRCYASADIFMMPSQTETFGLVTLEAMAAGLPVVAYDLA